MNRLLILLAFVCFGCGHCEADAIGGANSLRVVVKVLKANVRIGETFKVSLRVENPTPTNQYVLVWGCGWTDHWKTDNTNVVLFGQECAGNGRGRVEIEPGGAYIEEGEMQVLHSVPGNKLSFRMGFTPYIYVKEFNLGKTLWSEEVEIDVTP